MTNIYYREQLPELYAQNRRLGSPGRIYPLKWLRLEACPSLSLQGVQSLVFSSPHLASLQLINCMGLDGAVLTCLARHLPQLTSLEVNSPLTASNMIQSLQICGPRLTSLSLGNVAGLGYRHIRQSL
jgi:hypothetical protein